MTLAIPTKETLNCGDSLTVQRFGTSRCGAWQHADRCGTGVEGPLF